MSICCVFVLQNIKICVLLTKKLLLLGGGLHPPAQTSTGASLWIPLETRHYRYVCSLRPEQPLTRPCLHFTDWLSCRGCSDCVGGGWSAWTDAARPASVKQRRCRPLRRRLYNDDNLRLRSSRWHVGRLVRPWCGIQQQVVHVDAARWRRRSTAVRVRSTLGCRPSVFSRPY